MRHIFLFLALMLVSFPCFAQMAPLRIELAEDRVDISTGFNGTRIVMFGVKQDADADIIVTLRGPEHTMSMRRKGRVMGAWMVTKTVEFRRVPSYYDFASTLDDQYFTRNLPFLKEYEVGINNLGFYPEDADEERAVVTAFRDALTGTMQKRGLYPLAVHAPQSIDGNFFKASFDLPPGVPTGLYRIETILVKDDAVIARDSRTLQVGQVGFNARVYLFAQNYSFFYGIFAVIMALAIGASAFTFLRRD